VTGVSARISAKVTTMTRKAILSTSLLLFLVAALPASAQDSPAASAAAADNATTGTIEGTVKNRWLSRIEGAVYVEKIEGKTFDPPKEKASMDQKNTVFVPHVLVVMQGTTVEFPNSDSVRHNVFSSKKSSTAFNLGTYEPGATKEVVFDKPGENSLLCNVHSEMSAFVIVTETPWFATTEKKGTFSIANVPAGTYRLTAWHEKLEGKTIDVTVEAGKTVTADFEGMENR
jgi:plastocyanin